MNINATFIGQIIALFAVFMLFAGYYLGKRKTKNPTLTAVAAFLTAFVPLFAIIFLAYLVLKDDIAKQPTA